MLSSLTGVKGLFQWLLTYDYQKFSMWQQMFVCMPLKKFWCET